MLKMVMVLPADLNADLLMTSAFYMAYVESATKRAYPYRQTDKYFDYRELEVDWFYPERVWQSRCPQGWREYELDGNLIDICLLDQLTKLQRKYRFEFWFEQRGKYAPEKCGCTLSKWSDRF